MTPRHVLVLGAASWNRMIHVDALPQGREATVFARRDTQAAGSTGVGKAMVAAALGHRVTLHCTLGRDPLAAKIIAACEDRGITLIVDEQDAPTPQHLNIMDKAGGRYSIFLANGPDAPTLDMARLSAAITAADAIFLSLCPSSLKALPLLKDARAPIHLDLHDYDGQTSWYDPFIATADVIQLSDVALPDPRPTIRTLLQGRVRVVILTKGSAGAEFHTHTDHITIPPAPATLIDSNGAGDAFSVALWHAQTAGDAPPAAGRFAATAAACAIETQSLFPKDTTAQSIAARLRGTR